MVELIWEGKYDEDGRRVAPLKAALPFQTVETVNEDPLVRQQQLELFAAGRETEWRNRLIWGDKKYVLPSLLPEFAGQVDLIYIDPPFATGQDFSHQAQVGEEEFAKEANAIEVKAYRDTWGNGLGSYLRWFYESVTFFHELLSETGSLYVHCDDVVSHSVKVILDEVFGEDNFRNHLVWVRDPAGKGAKRKSKQWARNCDTILLYSRGKHWAFHQQYTGLSKDQEKPYRYADERGRYKAVQRGDYSDKSMEEFRSQGKIHVSSTGKEYIKYYLSEAKSTLGSVWSDIYGLVPKRLLMNE